MNEAVPRNEAAVVDVLAAADRNNRSRTRIKISAALRTKIKEIAPIAEVTPLIEANRTIPRIRWVSTILAPTLQKNANVVIVKFMRPKIVKSASKMGAWDIFGMIAEDGPNF